MNIQPISGFITMGYHLTAIKYRDTQMKGITKHEDRVRQRQIHHPAS